jgi:NAD(P)-dependent dehydrogenase (short-subunit alcohol dehydrogenase family)
MSAEFDLTGEIAVLTGGAGILGARFADALAQHGARVALLEHDIDAAREVARAVNARHGERAAAYDADVGERAALKQARMRIEAEFGAATVLINNAATKSPNFFEPFETFPLHDWEQVMRVNATGVMLCCQEFGGGMAERGRGSIVNLLSIYGIVAPDQRIYEGSSYEGRAINTPAVYSASKAAVWGLTRYLAAYWGHRGVRVNAVTPGGVFSGQNDAFVQRYSARVPLGRMAQRDELTGAVVYLASPASSYVTGHNLVVDGGLTVW